MATEQRRIVPGGFGEDGDMNAFLQRVLLLLRLSLALGMMLALWPRLGAWVLPLGGLLFWAYGLVLALSFARLAWLDPGPGLSRPGGRELLGAWWRELWVFERVFALRQPFAEYAEPDHLPIEPLASPPGPGVLLLHGFSCNRGLWNVWMRRLRERGHVFVALSLEPAFGSIDDYAAPIEAALQQLTRHTGRPPVVVAHSMGGLALRAWWRQHGRPGGVERVQRVLTLGSPHAGTLTAALAPFVNTRQMRRHSEWQRALAAAESPAWRARFVCFFTRCDHVVCPAATALLPGATGREIAGGVGHLALVEHEAVFEALLAELEIAKEREP